MTEILQRETWHGESRELGDWFVLRKGARTARCAIVTHHFGWELRLLAGDELLQSQVCRTQEDVFTTGDTWKAALIEKGWT